MQITAFLDVTPCGLRDLYKCFRVTWCLHLQGRSWARTLSIRPGVRMQLLTICRTTGCPIPENSNLHCQCHENLESHTVISNGEATLCIICRFETLHIQRAKLLSSLSFFNEVQRQKQSSPLSSHSLYHNDFFLCSAYSSTMKMETVGSFETLIMIY
jgi:hypothetical protein